MSNEPFFCLSCKYGSINPQKILKELALGTGVQWEGKSCKNQCCSVAVQNKVETSVLPNGKKRLKEPLSPLSGYRCGRWSPVLLQKKLYSWHIKLESIHNSPHRIIIYMGVRSHITSGTTLQVNYKQINRVVWKPQDSYQHGF